MNYENIDVWKDAKTDDVVLNKALDANSKKTTLMLKSAKEFRGLYFAGEIGPGVNNLNVHTIRALVRVFTRISQSGISNPKIAIIYDESLGAEYYAKNAFDILYKRDIVANVIFQPRMLNTPSISRFVKEEGYSGGVLITKGNFKEGNICIKFLDSEGFLINASLFEKYFLQSFKIDDIHINDNIFDRKEFPHIIDGYLETLAHKFPQNSKGSDLSITVSPQGFLTEQHLSCLPGFVGAALNVYNPKKTINPRNSNSIRKVIDKAMLKKSKLVLLSGENGEESKVAVRYKRRYKVLEEGAIAALYLNKLIREKVTTEESYIIVSEASTALIDIIASKNNVEVIRGNFSSKEINTIINDKEDKKFLFCVDDDDRFYGKYNFGMKGSLESFEEIIAMHFYYENEFSNLYSAYTQLTREYGTFRKKVLSKNISKKQSKVIFNSFRKMTKMGNKKIKETVEISNDKQGNKVTKMLLADRSSIILRTNSSNNITLMVEEIHSKDENSSPFYFENSVEAWFNELSETFEDKKITFKAIIKYSSFIAIIVAIFFVVFNIVYTNGDVSKSSTHVFSVARAITDKANRFIWLSLWVWILFRRFISAWMQKRMFSMIGTKVKARYLYISALMGSFVAFVTPFAVGGDAIGYWYLRRKGFEKSKLIAVMATSTMWSETKFALQTILLVAIGWKVYAYIFEQNDPQASSALILFIIGLVWSYFSASMILILTTSKRFQHFCIKWVSILLEWIPLFHFNDPVGAANKAKFDFANLRSGMKKLWTKWWFVLEMMLYDMFPLFFDPFTILYISMGLYKSNLPNGTYISQIVINDIIGTANSMSITPGGSGTGEWLNMAIKNSVFKTDPHTLLSNGREIAAGMDLRGKLQYNWPMLFLSMFTIIVVIIIERKRQIFSLKRLYWKIILGTIFLIGVSAFIACFLCGTII